MTIRSLPISAVLLVLACLLPGQGHAQPPTCSCASTFDQLVDATQDNYGGFAIKVNGDRARGDYQRAVEVLRSGSAAAADEQCAVVLERYTSLFADHHLFTVLRNGPPPGTAREGRPWTTSRVRRALRRGDGDPVAGLWYDADGPVAVVGDAKLPPHTWAAVRHDGERQGEVIAYFGRDDAGYHSRYRHPQWGWQRARAAFHRESDLLVYGLQALGRQGAQRLDPSDPLRPHLIAADGKPPYLSMPSFLPQYRQVLSDLIKTHAAALAQAQTLVVDVRGNAGGDAIYFELGPILLDGEIEVSTATSVLASPWTIESLADMRERQGAAGVWLDEPLQRMRAAPGQVVAFGETRTAALPETAARPTRIAVLQDRGVGSAAEAFIFHVRQSGKVTTLGEPTRGNLDYMQVSMRPIGCGDFAAWFGYPLYFRATLPSDSIDDEGFAPALPLSRDLDWVEFAQQWLQAP